MFAAVRARTPLDDREQRSIGTILATLGRLGDDPFDEHANPVHVTASALIVGRRVVACTVTGCSAPGLPRVVTSTPTNNPGRQPSAKRARRPACGVLGLASGSSDLVHVDVHPGPRGHTHLDLRYLVDGDDGDPAPPPDESQDVFWFTWAEALRIAEPSMIGILTRLRSRS